MYDFKPPYYGAAYYPEAWPREEIDADLDRAMAHGLNTLRVAEFAWSTMEPEEGKYDFSLFREVVDKCKARGISVIMCTPSATPPSWMEHKYPEVLMTAGELKATHGHRRRSCPTNPKFREFCDKIVEKMALEFQDDENIIGWQIDNEFSIMPAVGERKYGCTCRYCTNDFRKYLKEKYGTIEKLNDEWGNFTWSLNFSSFEEIVPFTGLLSLPAPQKFAWEEYKSHAYSDFCKAQADILHKYVKVPVGTDMMPTQQLNIPLTNKSLDIAQLNHYGGPAHVTFWLDVYRGIFDRPLWITETAAYYNGSQKPGGNKKKGFCRANTMMGFAFGGEAALYWLFRSHRAGHEMGHGAVVDAWGRDFQTSDEIRGISRELDLLAPMIRQNSVKKSGMAISFGHRPYVMDKYASMIVPEFPDYAKDIRENIYDPLMHAHFHPDVIFPGADLSAYKLLISHRQLTLDEEGFTDRILPWVEQGGTWVVGPNSDIFTRHLAKHKNAPYGHLEDWANIRRAFVEPAPHPTNGMSPEILPTLRFADGTKAATNPMTYDALEAGEGVKVLATYEDNDYLPGYAAITETPVGKGRIIVLGAELAGEDYVKFISYIAAQCGIAPIAQGDANVVTTLLDGGYGQVFCAIEAKGDPGRITVPFDAENIVTGEGYRKGQVLDMQLYQCVFAKRIK